MKSTGKIRKIDELGRIVLPFSLRYELGISENSYLEFFREKDSIIIKKSKLTCVFCGTNNNLTKFKNQDVCKSCISGLKDR
ncbi:MAG: AbrB/MazE/SpoVT family DNA-binding domain-containing protein [Oscillospiraceae bacterium]|nr:AbrB/MazE/SpoVT family DNA-binding domain-containing protein [Oscillospiraceae bacterium]